MLNHVSSLFLNINRNAGSSSHKIPFTKNNAGYLVQYTWRLLLWKLLVKETPYIYQPENLVKVTAEIVDDDRFLSLIFVQGFFLYKVNFSKISIR